MNPIIEQIVAFAQRQQHSSSQSHYGGLGGMIGVALGWRFSRLLDMPPAAAASVVAVMLVFAGLLLYRAIGESKSERRFREWGISCAWLDDAIMKEEARAEPDRAYIERLESLRRELTRSLVGRDGGTSSSKKALQPRLRLPDLDEPSGATTGDTSERGTGAAGVGSR